MPAPLRLELVSLRRADNWHNLVFLGVDWLTIAAAAGLAMRFSSVPTYLAAVVVIGSRQRALMNLVHEASHRKLFRSRALNDWLGCLFAALPLATSLDGYVCAHCRHHGFLWDSERDPKALRYRQLGLVALSPRLGAFLSRHVLFPLLLMHVPVNVVSSLSWSGERRTGRVVRVCFWFGVLTTVILTHTLPVVTMFWFVPYLTSFQFIRYLTEMAEHAGLNSPDPWLASRNWSSSFLVSQLLAPHSDDHYHLTHHLFPAIPHYRLKQADELLMAVPQYAAGHHCYGFFFSRTSSRPTVLHDILERQESPTVVQPSLA